MQWLHGYATHLHRCHDIVALLQPAPLVFSPATFRCTSVIVCRTRRQTSLCNTADKSFTAAVNILSANRGRWTVYIPDAETPMSVCAIPKNAILSPSGPVGHRHFWSGRQHMNRPPTTDCLCDRPRACVLECVRARVSQRCCWNIKVALQWTADVSKTGLLAKPLANTHLKIYIYTQFKGIPRCA